MQNYAINKRQSQYITEPPITAGETYILANIWIMLQCWFEILW